MNMDGMKSESVNATVADTGHVQPVCFLAPILMGAARWMETINQSLNHIQCGKPYANRYLLVRRRATESASSSTEPFRFRKAQCASKSILPLAVIRNISQPGPPRAPPMVFRVVALGIDQPSAAWRVGMGGSKRAVAWPSHSRKLQSLPATCIQASSIQSVDFRCRPRPRRPQMQRADLGRR
ncbi:hypothetical protein CI102_3944 [Trichoderma harzianum]|nr:hypothetical protein CI102_3944 [Trichoderma harzianum]